MQELILDALKLAIKQYPEIMDYLKGDAAWYGGVYAFKVGEAPDDDVRLKDEKRLELRLREFLEGQLNRIIKKIEKQYKSIEPSFWDDELLKMWEMLGNDFVGIMMHGAMGGINLIPDLPVDMDSMMTDLVRWGRKYRDTWLSKIEETSRDYVQEQITQWELSGDPLSVLIRTMREDKGGMFSKIRSSRIAVTEVTRLHALGNQAAWEKAGDVKQFKYMTAQDELVCPKCKENNANSPYPLARLGEMIPAHVNCRCWAQPIVDISNLEEEIREMLR